MSVFIQLDRPRELKFGFNALSHLKTNYGYKNVNEIANALKDSDFTVIPCFIEACILGDSVGIEGKKMTDLMDNYLAENGMDKLLEILKQTFDNSVFMNKDKKKVKAKQ